MNAIALCCRRWLVSLLRGWRSVAPGRAALGLLLIVAYLAASIGFPVYRPAAAQLAEAPYPCQFGKCGCRTREQCRTNCCCHTTAEKVAWAQARGIDPNTVAVLTPDDQRQLASGTLKAEAKVRTCCQAKIAADAKPACCSVKAKTAKQAEKKILTFVLGIDAQKCSGTGTLWIESGFVALPLRRWNWLLHYRQSICCRVSRRTIWSPRTGIPAGQVSKNVFDDVLLL